MGWNGRLERIIHRVVVRGEDFTRGGEDLFMGGGRIVGSIEVGLRKLNNVWGDY